MGNTTKLPFFAVRKQRQLFPPSFPDRPLFRRLTHKRHSRTLTWRKRNASVSTGDNFHHEWPTTWLPGRERGCIRGSQRNPWNAHNQPRHHSHGKKRESEGEQCFLTTFWLKSQRLHRSWATSVTSTNVSEQCIYQQGYELKMSKQ